MFSIQKKMLISQFMLALAYTLIGGSMMIYMFLGSHVTIDGVEYYVFVTQDLVIMLIGTIVLSFPIAVIIVALKWGIESKIKKSKEKKSPTWKVEVVDGENRCRW